MNIRSIFTALFIIGICASVPLMGMYAAEKAKIFKSEPQNSVCKHLDDANFEATIAKGLVVVDFYADWCSPCQKLGPLFEQTASQMTGKLTFAKANVDIASRATQKYNVSSIPTLIIFKDGKELKRRTGGCDLKTLQSFVNNL